MSKSEEFVKRSHSLEGDTGRLAEHYGTWAASYDEDLRDWEWRGPEEIGDLYVSLADAHPWLAPDPGSGADSGVGVLDAGCGTGLVGVVLARHGAGFVDGFDLSEAMVEQARATGVYRALKGGVDMNGGLTEYADNTYDVTVSSGVFTLGHVPPEGLDPLLRVTRTGGLVLVTTHKSYLDTSAFEAHVADLAGAGTLKVVRRLQDVPYTAETPADYWAFEVRREGN